MTESDIEGGTLSADDFTAMIKMPPHKESVEKLQPILWAWVEDILGREANTNYMNLQN